MNDDFECGKIQRSVTNKVIGVSEMKFSEPIKLEIEVFPSTVVFLEKLGEKAGMEKGEIVENVLKNGIPITIERACEMIEDDIEIRTSRLSEEDKRAVLVWLLNMLYEKLND